MPSWAGIRYRSERWIRRCVNRFAGRGDFHKGLREVFAPALLARLTPLASTWNSPRILFCTDDEIFAPRLIAEDSYETHLSWVLAHLDHPQRSGVFVDVGANIGTTAIPVVAKYGGLRVLAFEPEPLNCKLFKCNVILNGLEDRIQLREVVISDTEGFVELELSKTNHGDHRVRVDLGAQGGADRFAESARETIRVAAITLDEALARDGLDPAEIGLVWIDAQGHEGQILAGAPRLLGHRVPLVIEYWPYGLRRSSGLGLLNEIISTSFRSVVDINASIKKGRTVKMPAGDIAVIAANLEDDKDTNLILLH